SRGWKRPLARAHAADLRVRAVLDHLVAAAALPRAGDRGGLRTGDVSPSTSLRREPDPWHRGRGAFSGELDRVVCGRIAERPDGSEENRNRARAAVAGRPAS